MPPGRRVCPAVAVMAITVRSFAFFDMDMAAATAPRRDPTVDERIMTRRETACGDVIEVLRVHVLNFNSQPRRLSIFRL